MDLMTQLKWEAFLTFYTQGHSACPEEDQICRITGFLWACAAPWRQVWGLVEFWVKEHTDAILFQRHMHRQLHTYTSC